MSNFKKKIKNDILNDLATPNVLESVKSNPTFLNTNVSSLQVKTFNFRRLSRVLTVSLSVAAIVIIGIIILPKAGFNKTNNDAMRNPQRSEKIDEESRHNKSSKEDFEPEDYQISEPGDSDEEAFMDSIFVDKYYGAVITNSLDMVTLSNLYTIVCDDVEKGMSLDEILLELGTTNEESITYIYNYLTK